jgi:zinc protease
MVIAVVGAVSPPEIIAQIEQRLAGWQPQVTASARIFPPVQPPPEPIRRHISIGGKMQTDLVLGTLGPRRGDPDFFAAALGNNILGQLGMMGRIGEIVREQNGLAYYAAANLVASYAAGSWEISAGVEPPNLEQVIDLMLTEIQRFTRETVSREEMEDSKANLVGRLPLALQSNAGVAGALINIERFQLGLDYYRQYPALIQKVTREEVLETARRFLGLERMVIVSAGPDGD